MLVSFALYVDDMPGVLNRVASLFRRRGFNIVSLTVGGTERPRVSRMTVVVETDEAGACRVEHNLHRLLNVRRVERLSPRASVRRDLALIKVAAPRAVRPDIMRLVDVFRARVVDVAPDSLIVEITGTEDKIDGLFDVLCPYGVLEMARTGCAAMARGTAPPPDAPTNVDEDAAEGHVACSV